MTEKMNDNYIGIDEAAEYLDIKTVTLRTWIKKDPTFPAFKIGKCWKFKRSELDRWVQNQQDNIVKKEVTD